MARTPKDTAPSDAPDEQAEVQSVLSIDAPCEPLPDSACASCALFDQGQCSHLWLIELGHTERVKLPDCHYHQPTPGTTA